MAKLACPLACRGNAEVQLLPDLRQLVGCETCGDFELSQQLAADLRDPTALRDKHDLLPYLRAYTRSAYERGMPASLTSDNWEEFARMHANTPIHEKATRLLLLLASRARPGQYADIYMRRDAPLLDCYDDAEVEYLVNSLVDANLIRTTTSARGGEAPSYMLLIDGWQRLAPTPAGLPGQGFVAMSYHESLSDAWKRGILPAIETDCRPARAIRLDKTEHNEKICDKIQVEIRLAEFLVADVTRQSAGVYFEAGFAMAIGRQVIWTCREDDFKNVHFDTRQYNYIVWTDEADLRRQLATRIKATVPSFVKRNAP